MEFGIFNLMGSRDPAKPTAEVFAEVAEQTRVADELGYTIAWFASTTSRIIASARRR
jgi:alkanesulfonate monooxygenase SsuD/methylene tetrahydromethanopterin reductase-like flavin-dependent oxidoreductase (luciferase family)